MGSEDKKLSASIGCVCGKRWVNVGINLTQQILFKEYSVGAIVDTAINSFCEYDRVIGINEYLTALSAVTLDDVKHAIQPFLNKKEFLNIRVNCDREGGDA